MNPADWHAIEGRASWFDLHGRQRGSFQIADWVADEGSEPIQPIPLAIEAKLKANVFEQIQGGSKPIILAEPQQIACQTLICLDIGANDQALAAHLVSNLAISFCLRPLTGCRPLFVTTIA